MTAPNQNASDNPVALLPVRNGRVPTPSMVNRARADREADPEVRHRAPRSATPLERTSRLLHRSGLQLLGVVFCVAYLGGAYGHRRGWIALAFGVPLAMTALTSMAWRLRGALKGLRVAPRMDAAVGFVTAQLAFALLQLSGDRHSPLYPLLYLLTAFFAVAPWPRALSIGLVLAVVTQNALRYICADALPTEWGALAIQTGFMGVFALLYHLLLSSRLSSARLREKQAVAVRLKEAEELARGLRLVVADRSQDQRGPASEDELARRLLLGAILEVEKSVGSLMESAQLAIGGHALALYWLATDDATLHLRDGRSPAGLLAPGPLPSGDGLLGSVLRHSQPLRQCGKVPGVNWYQRSVRIRSVAAVPVIERMVDGTGYVRGVLLADRLEPEPFSDRDAAFLNEVAQQVSRAVEAERLVGELHRAKDAQDRLQRAAEQLNRSATIEEVTQAAARIARELVPSLDLAAVTRVDESASGPVHIVAAAEGSRAREFDGLVYDDNDGLVAQVVRVGAPLPPKAPAVLERVKVFDLKLRAVGSLRVMPLHASGRVLGTLVAASGQRNVLDGEARRRLESLSVIVAGALARALALHEVSQLATTDGLTGIANRRQLELLGDRLFREAARYQRSLSVIVLDIDHFKRVNDGHGHAAGDEVLRGVAGTLRDLARGADVVGRHGGEEFLVILPNTDGPGAALFAERVRARIAATDFTTPAGPLRVTASLGVAAFPLDAKALADLIGKADEALYAAKANGRNRVVAASEVGQRRTA
jgi:diguanylate cyclase (GGDEF)-like protein